MMATGTRLFFRELVTLPNILSMSRIPGIYVAMALFLSGYPRAGLAVGFFTAITDYFDGILARKLDQVTKVGALLDQLGDILFESSGILLAVLMGAWHPGFIYVYLFRNFTNISVRMAAALGGRQIPSVFLGKLGANFNFYSLLLCFLVLGQVIPAPYDGYAMTLSVVGITMGLGFGLVSMGMYIAAYVRSYGEPAGEDRAGS